MPIIDIDAFQNIAKNLNYEPALADLNISIKDDNSTIKSTYQVLEELADLWSKVDNSNN